MSSTRHNYYFQTAQDLIDKAKREKDHLFKAVEKQDEYQIADAIFNFSVTAFHIKDWLRNESWGYPFEYEDVENYINNQLFLSICADLCNGSKHKILTRKNRSQLCNVTNLPLNVNMEIFVNSKIPINGYIAVIELEDGRKFDIFRFANQVISAWERFYNQYSVE